MRIVIPILFLLSAVVMRQWEFLIPVPIPNLVLALAAAGAVRQTPLGPYLLGAVLAALALSYPVLLGTEAFVFLFIALLMYFAAPRLAWRDRVIVPLFVVAGSVLLYFFTGGGSFLAREPLLYAGELALTLAASAVFATPKILPFLKGGPANGGGGIYKILRLEDSPPPFLKEE